VWVDQSITIPRLIVSLALRCSSVQASRCGCLDVLETVIIAGLPPSYAEGVETGTHGGQVQARVPQYCGIMTAHQQLCSGCRGRGLHVDKTPHILCA
jgi:hypothetical protein